jgi:tetratricopeptide (TPR) repeat protein
MFYLQKNDYKQAQKYLTTAYDLESFPEKTTLILLQTLAGLCMQDEHFDKAVSYYRAYLKLAKVPGKDIYLGLGTAYFQKKEYNLAIKILENAIRQLGPNESCYVTLFSSYYELKQLDKAATVLEKMIRLWPEKSKYWLQLASLYIEMNNYNKAIEIMQLAFTQSYLVKEKNFLQYVYALYEAHLPFKAAVAIQKGMQQNVIKKNLKNYELLSTMYLEAKERKKAILALKQATSFSKDGHSDLLIAQLYFEMEDAFDKVIEHAKKAIKKGIKQEGNANMLIAVAYSELGKTENAKEYFTTASKFETTQKASLQWLQSLP